MGEEKKKSNVIVKVMAIILGVIALLYLIGIFMPEEKPPIKYDVLKDYERGQGKTLEILIPPETETGQIISLAKYLYKKNNNFHFLYINIFDSKGAYLRRDDLSYPEKEFGKHWLLSIGRNNTTGYNKAHLLDKKTGKFKEIKLFAD